MKNLMTRLFAVLALSIVVSASALAGETKKDVSFSSDVTINGTLVKKGKYQVVYDDKTGEMSIRKGKEELVKATTRTEDRQKKAIRLEMLYTQNGENRSLQGFAFEGSNQNIVINGNAQAATPQQ
ncbi:MAG TPA: DUF2911 domain-containing protein [Acidobacteriota bacterium]|nr:DUF2911 domain-containing protein [Acidobacteriota bacterium]HNB70457.1 DUF2911 domain-containing protein [Acidobacteriota bacterium]HND17941.1 DUF2911 domain-containing protein [Acidobacteriota bacterium]HNG95406.1 DUF2911 domain-containing protein [Acidobacteriota bacterium]HNH83619.1 DUF2911 domain-containing protein [Acidobacteriota bacterium]